MINNFHFHIVNTLCNYLWLSTTCVCVCVCVCMYACVHVCVCVCVCVCVWMLMPWKVPTQIPNLSKPVGSVFPCSSEHTHLCQSLLSTKVEIQPGFSNLGFLYAGQMLFTTEFLELQHWSRNTGRWYIRRHSLIQGWIILYAFSAFSAWLVRC